MINMNVKPYFPKRDVTKSVVILFCSQKGKEYFIISCCFFHPSAHPVNPVSVNSQQLSDSPAIVTVG